MDCLRRRLLQLLGKPHQEENSGALLATNVDLVREMLLRLPAASVVRFRVVCKEWLFITEDPSFVAAYTRRSPRGVLASTWRRHSTYSCSTLDGSYLFPPWSASESERHLLRGSAISDSCNGLLLETLWSGDMSVYNPATMQRRILPRCPLPSGLVFHKVLAFEPWRSSNYRVLVLSRRRNVMYSRETDSWQTLFWPGVPGPFSSHCCCNGVVHWLREDGLLASADLENNTAAAFPAPMLHDDDDDDEKYDYVRCFGTELSGGGRLRVLRARGDPKLPGASVLQVLELAGDNSRWLLLHTYCNTNVDSDPFASYSHCCLVDGELVMMTVENKIVAYNLGSGTIRELRTLNYNPVVPWLSPRRITWVPTLITLVPP